MKLPKYTMWQKDELPHEAFDLAQRRTEFLLSIIMHEHKTTLQNLFIMAYLQGLTDAAQTREPRP
jgi:hypothetical protein